MTGLDWALVALLLGGWLGRETIFQWLKRRR
jgi:hypothetical protein